jgi:hypothetical protein
VVLGHAVFRGVLGARALDVYDERVLDAEDGVGGLEGVVAEVEGAFDISAQRTQQNPKRTTRKAKEENEGITHVIK